MFFNVIIARSPIVLVSFGPQFFDRLLGIIQRCEHANAQFDAIGGRGG